MTTEVRITAQWGRVLWMNHEQFELGIALDFGIRIVHASCPNMENLLYRQPDDLSDGYYESNGWRLYGGHRMWAAPEGPLSTTPDNLPVHWQNEPDGILIWEDPNPITGFQKSLKLICLSDGTLRLIHSFKNISANPVTCASWGITSFAPGGSARVDFSYDTLPACNPRRSISLWGSTSLQDPRLRFDATTLYATFAAIPDFCKIGIYSYNGVAVYENKNQHLTISFPTGTIDNLPDCGCNFELFLCQHFMELETLGELTTLMPGDAASHWEEWKFETKQKGCTDMIKTEKNLIPETINTSPDYYCTWQTQLYATSDGKPEGQRRCLGEAQLFGNEKPYGWAYFHPQARKDLLLVMDDSWDVPLNGNPDYYGSLQLDPEKFPESNAHDEPLKYLADQIRQVGWKGLGGWVCAQESSLFPAETVEEYWKKRVQQAQSAGFTYWKVDWGNKAEDPAFRNMQTELSKVWGPDLVVEHAMLPSVIPESDCFRTYDVPAIASIPMTMEKLSAIADMPPAKDGCAGLVNCEDEVYMAAAGGYTMGVMRHPYAGPFPNGKSDMSFPEIHRNLKTKMFEVVRAVHWHRIAPAFDAGYGTTQVSDELLTDYWEFHNIEEEIELWWLNMPLKKNIENQILTLKAPATIARNTALPSVQPDQDNNIPYIVCSHNPNGTYAIVTAGRTLGRDYFIPKCHIAAEIGDSNTIGIFGEYASLTLKTNGKVPTKVFMQDLAAGSAIDITGNITICDSQITIPGELIHEIGTAAQPTGDTSEPGVVLAIF